MRRYKFVAIVLFSLGSLMILVAIILSNNNVDNLNEIKKEYSYIKSYDVTKRTQVKFLLYSDPEAIVYTDSEYSRMFVNKELEFYVTALTMKTNLSIEEYLQEEMFNYREELNSEDITLKTEEITCSYLCYRVTLTQNSQIIEDGIKIYIDTSPIDFITVKYYFKNQNISSELIQELISNISIDYNAKYTIGYNIDDKLIIGLEEIDEHKKLQFVLDSNIYQEVEDSVNELRTTTVVNKNNSERVILKMYSDKVGDNILESIEMYYNFDEINNNKEDIQILNRTFKKYHIQNENIYVYVINDNNALIISMNENADLINDFANFTL